MSRIDDAKLKRFIICVFLAIALIVVIEYTGCYDGQYIRGRWLEHPMRGK